MPRSHAALEQQIQELTRKNNELQEQLHAAYSGSISIKGYLLKHRPVTQLMGLFSQEWEMRYCVLSGTVLRHYRSERDIAGHPRGVMDVQGCCVEPEEQAGHRQWRWRIVEPGGNVLLRLGTDNQAAAERWLSCLQAAGLRLAHSREGAASSGGAGSKHAADSRMQERWEASSTDSEIPESLSKAARQQQHRGTALHERLLQEQREQRQAASAQQACTAAAAAMAAGVAAATTGQAPATTSHQQLPVRLGGSGAAADADASARQQAQASSAAAGPSTSGGGASRPPMSGSTPVHTSVRYSYLSSDSIWLAKHDGLLNLAVIILIAANFRLLLENLLKYGWRLNFISYIARSLAGRGNLPLVLAFPALVALSLLALASEKLGCLSVRAEEQYLVLLSKRFDDEKQRQQLYRSRVRQTEVLMLLLHTLCSGAAFLLPCIVIHLTQADAVPGIFLMLWTLTVVMKLISYAHCHTDLRAAHRRNSLTPGERGAPGTSPEWAALRYPENLTVSNMLYYLAAPTLTYQVNFPRSPRVRKRWLLRRVLELAAFTGLLLFIANQYLEPAVSNAMKPLSESDWLRVLERVLKLALPNLYAWLCMFYCLFHLYLNILGELTCFGDRVFYQDWWNAATIGAYWRTWNQPVHKWLLRTVYFPAMKHGCNRWWAMILVFLVSAIGHEVVVGVPLHMLRGWAFWGIMLQVPLISLTEKLRQRLKSDTWGNYAFWLTFCIIGQPVCLLMYVHDYIYTHGGYRQLSSNIVGQATAVGAAAGVVGDYLRDA